MNQIVNSLISAVQIARQALATQEHRSSGITAMRGLDADELRAVVGGDDDTGPRGGWKAVALVSSV